MPPLRAIAEASGFTVEWCGADSRIELLSPKFKTVLESFLNGERLDFANKDGIIGYLSRSYPYVGKLKLSTDYSGDWPLFYVSADELEAYIECDATMRSEIQGVNAELLMPEMSPEDKLLAINAYICRRWSYDYDEKKDRDLTEAWESDVVTCTGYARIFEAMARDAGFKVDCVVGQWMKNGKTVTHMWNRVFHDGEWKHIDTCWSDGSTGDPYWLLTRNEMDKRHVGV